MAPTTRRRSTLKSEKSEVFEDSQRLSIMAAPTVKYNFLPNGGPNKKQPKPQHDLLDKLHQDLFKDGKIHSESKSVLFNQKLLKIKQKNTRAFDTAEIRRRHSIFYGLHNHVIPMPMAVSDSVRIVVLSSLCWFVIFYTIFFLFILIGAALYTLSESGEEERLRQIYLDERKKMFFALFNKRPDESEAERQEFILSHLRSYVSALHRLQVNHCFDPRFGAHRDTGAQWSYGGGLLHVSGLVSTLGYSDLCVRTLAGRVQDILFLLLLLPLHFMLLTQAGFLLSTGVTLMLRRVIPGLWWHYCRCKKMDTEPKSHKCVIVADRFSKSFFSKPNSGTGSGSVSSSKGSPAVGLNRARNDRMTVAQLHRKSLVANLLDETSLLKNKTEKDVESAAAAMSKGQTMRESGREDAAVYPVHTPVGLLHTHPKTNSLILHAGRNIHYYVNLEGGKYALRTCKNHPCQLCEVTQADQLLRQETLGIFEYRVPELLVTALLLFLYELTFASYLSVTSDIPYYRALYFSMATLSTSGMYSFNIPTYNQPLRYRAVDLMVFLHLGLVIVAACLQPKPRPGYIIVIGNMMDQIPDLRPAFIIEYFKKQKTIKNKWERYFIEQTI